MTSSQNQLSWYASKHFRRIAWVLLAVVLGVCFINGVLRRHNDFRIHHKLGVGFLEGKPYLSEEGPPELNNYPVGRLLLNAPLGLFPYRLSRGICWAVAAGSLLCSLGLWQIMARRRDPLERSRAFAATAFGVAVGLTWLVRDLDDCGLQLILLFMLTCAAWWTWQKRSVLAGLTLAAAVSYKATPVIFFPFLLYKRRWREAGWTVVFVIVLNLVLPAAWLGWDKTIGAHEVYLHKVQSILRAGWQDPTANGVQPATLRNRSLRSAIGRYLQTYGPGSGGPGGELFIPHPDDHVEGEPVAADARAHPLFIQFLDLPGPTVNLIIAGGLLGLLVWLAVAFRGKWGEGWGRADPAVEWAVVTLLCALLSPLCWGQHMVLAIPAVVLAMREALSGRMRLWRKIVLVAAVVLIVTPQRELLGKTLWLVVLSYKPETIATTLLLALLLTARRGDQTTISEAGTQRA